MRRQRQLRRQAPRAASGGASRRTLGRAPRPSRAASANSSLRLAQRQSDASSPPGSASTVGGAAGSNVAVAPRQHRRLIEAQVRGHAHTWRRRVVDGQPHWSRPSPAPSARQPLLQVGADERAVHVLGRAPAPRRVGSASGLNSALSLPRGEQPPRPRELVLALVPHVDQWSAALAPGLDGPRHVALGVTGCCARPSLGSSKAPLDVNEYERAAASSSSSRPGPRAPRSARRQARCRPAAAELARSSRPALRRSPSPPPPGWPRRSTPRSAARCNS